VTCAAGDQTVALPPDAACTRLIWLAARAAGTLAAGMSRANPGIGAFLALAFVSGALPNRVARGQGPVGRYPQPPTIELDLQGEQAPLTAAPTTFGQLVLPVRINGQDVRMMLDANAPACWLSRSKAEQLGLTLRPWRQESELPGATRVHLTEPIAWQIGAGVRARGRLVVIEVPEALRAIVDGAIGLNLLAERAFAIRWAARRVTFLASSPADAPEGFAALNLERHRPGYSVPCRLEGFGPIRCLFDIATNGLAVRRRVWRSLGRAGRIGRFVYAGGSALGGSGVSLKARCPPLHIGPFCCRQLLIQVGDTPRLMPARRVDAVAGIDVWKRFDLIVDLANRKLYVQPNEMFDDPEPYNRSGLLCRPVPDQQQGLVVWRIVPDSPADRAGIRQGDVLLAINGQTMDRTAPAAALLSLLQPAGTGVELTVRRQDKTFTRKIVLAELLGPPPSSNPR